MEADPFSFLSGIISNGIHVAPMTIGVLVALFCVMLLLYSSAMISGSEVAFFSLSPSDIKDLKEADDERDKQLVHFLNNQDKLLATILIANNFINVAVVILFTFISSSLFDFSSNQVLGFVIEVVVITLFLLLFGEILPKVYASANGIKMARRMAKTLNVLETVFRPFNVILIASTNIVNKRITKKSQQISMDELSSALELASDEIADEKEILEGIVKFGNISVGEIMVSRVDIIDIDIQSSFKQVIDVIVESGYSRIPVFNDTLDHIKGILYIKDLLPHLQKPDNVRWQSLIRPPYYVPETKKINDLLEEFQTNKIHMAVVIDEYGGTSGIVTLEDILEEIVGEISDEFDEEEVLYKKLDDGSFEFEAKMMINDFFKVTGIDALVFDKVRGDADTLAGLILEYTGEMPKGGKKIVLEGYTFEVLSVDNRRIKKIRFNPEIVENEEQV